MALMLNLKERVTKKLNYKLKVKFILRIIVVLINISNMKLI